MADDFLSALMSNTARAKVLRAFILSQTPFTISQAAKRAGVSTSVASKEIRMLTSWGVVKKTKFSIEIAGEKRISGRQQEDAWAADPDFEHAAALSKFVHEVSPLPHDSILPALKRAGRVTAVILSGTFLGDQSRPADLIIAMDALNENRVETAVRSLEPLCGREIRYAAFSTPEFRYRLTIQDRLLRDTLDYPHLVLLDKEKLL